MVPNGWSLKLISDTSKVITGNTPSTKIREYYGGNIPFVSPADLGGSKHISVATKKLTVEGFKKARSIRAGSTLFTCIGSTIGKLGMSATEVATNQQINAVVPYDKFDDDFIYYQLELRAVFIAKLAGTQAVPIINKTTFESQSLLVPDSLPEQRKIAKILSTWDKAISTTERLIDNSKQQKKALMQQLLTGKKRLLDDSGKPFEGEWEDVLLGNIVDRPICYGVLKPGDHTEGGIPLLRIQDLKGSLLNESQMIRITEELHQEFKRTILREGDLVMSIVGTLGKVLKIPSQLEGANITRAFAVIGIAEHSTDFIKQYLTSDYIQEWLLNTATGNAQKVLNVAAIKKLKINVPAIEEQRKIAIVLGYADKEIELFEQQLADLKQEKKALMQQLLTGKRRVKIDDKEVA